MIQLPNHIDVKTLLDNKVLANMYRKYIFNIYNFYSKEEDYKTLLKEAREHYDSKLFGQFQSTNDEWTRMNEWEAIHLFLLEHYSNNSIHKSINKVLNHSNTFWYKALEFDCVTLQPLNRVELLDALVLSIKKVMLVQLEIMFSTNSNTKIEVTTDSVLFKRAAHFMDVSHLEIKESEDIKGNNNTSFQVEKSDSVPQDFIITHQIGLGMPAYTIYIESEDMD